MSWLFGRRNDDDEEDDEDYTEEDEDESLYSTDEEDEEVDQETNVNGGTGPNDKEEHTGASVDDVVPVTEENGKDKTDEDLSSTPAPPPPPPPDPEQSVDPGEVAEAPTHDDDKNEASERSENESAEETPSAAVVDEPTIASVDAQDAHDATAEGRNDETARETKQTVDPEDDNALPEERPEEESSEASVGKMTETAEVDQAAKTEETTSNEDNGIKVETAEDDDEDKKDGGKEEVEEVTSIHEKRSLLVLAAEHDRVDILNAILADESEDRDTLLNGSIPPLHISIAYGSTNAVQCLLRMGADPSVRPDVKQIKKEADAGKEEQLVDIPNTGRFDNMSAWELAFGKSSEEKENQENNNKKSGWFGGGDAGRKSSAVDIAPSKLVGIRHAFTAEGLRCIGSDEVARLKQLLDSGMPDTIDIGGKNLYDWAVEMGALQCEELLRPSEAERNTVDESKQVEGEDAASSSETGSTAVLDRSKPGAESLSQLQNRIVELESLSTALSSCLDNLAEEVSVCHGLLLMGGGATALAAHVRSLKTLKENKMEELERLEEAWENSEDELAWWAKECGEQGKEIAELMPAAIISSAERKQREAEGSPKDEQTHMQQLKAQAAALENKIRKLRASITDLSEENTRDLEEVELRGLSGGIKLVRTLRDEIRDVEFTLNESKSAEALCRAKIKLIQSMMGGKKQSTLLVSEGSRDQSQPAADNEVLTQKETNGTVGTVGEATSESPQVDSEPMVETTSGDAVKQVEPEPKPVIVEAKRPTEAIETGHSSALAVKKQGGGYFTVDLWQILLRIIGLGSRPVASSPSSGSNVMIV